MSGEKKIKILYITPALYSAGGVERIISYKANYFADVYGFCVTIIMTEGNGKDCFFPVSDKVEIINYELDFEALWLLPLWKKILVYLQKQYI